jgi:hypothetical protein
MLRRLFRKKETAEEQKDVTSLGRLIGEVIESTCMEVFANNREVLLAEKNTYIIPAIWGAAKDAELTPVQREIHGRVAPTVVQIVDSLKTSHTSEMQVFALEYLVRGLLVSKIIYMVELYGNLTSTQTAPRSEGANLNELDPWGRA